jgi:hypothetical protein
LNIPLSIQTISGTDKESKDDLGVADYLERLEVSDVETDIDIIKDAFKIKGESI